MNAAHPDREIIAVAHIGVILSQVALALTGSATQALSHKIDNLSVTTLRFEGAWSVDASITFRDEPHSDEHLSLSSTRG